MRLGRDARRCLDDRIPEALGVTAQDWLISVFGASYAKIKRALRIEASLRRLPDAEVKQLTEGAAYDLTRLPEKERTAPEWVSKAKALASAEFHHAVDTRLAKIRGDAEPPEPFIVFRVSLPKGVYDELKAAESKVAGMLEEDIEEPRGRIATWQAVANLINTTDVQIIKQETVGGG